MHVILSNFNPSLTNLNKRNAEISLKVTYILPSIADEGSRDRSKWSEVTQMIRRFDPMERGSTLIDRHGTEFLF